MRASPEAALEVIADTRLGSLLKDWAKYWSIPMQPDAGGYTHHQNEGPSH